ncbi:putative tRNA nucleotidyltransferase [Leptomonas pyrrhocoris]|uniref:Putative tRNA nucleotidyltransferase n=1 Tax=Leptomonas pyrrhocoris TaxID=157538 RepID=A0A0M9FTA5_LEPPY|nr:putative tRNA nucleotidyltransferase [Leptomonas pyrrhocoris]KPA75625.1 putative tRNA nucleotidyltransferase [Leptomonas pyrrhocoris]|eukprot:XP_015654064.1 putative tRNA nucleotidyltransferase [Leptomonas pyrrhocoris]
MMIPRVVRLEAAISTAHQNVFACLLNVDREYELKTTLRVAGGWVRDALLGLHSNDIDIAIETPVNVEPVSGEVFARRIAEYQQAHGDRAHTVSVIRANPAMSKHIETATVRVHEIPVEFCGLRTDVYTDASRIPQVRPGTPLEDALRRDFTINALFYNLHTGMVEDYTTGLDDLRRRVIRCPLEPRTTFNDDPLRLLRGVRFVGQLGALNFSLDPSVTESVDEALLQVLLQKVSRERIGKEFVKMMAAAHPERCIELLHSMQILQHVLLVSVVMKAQPGKKQLSSDVERMDKLVDVFADGAARLNAAMLLSTVGLPTLVHLGVTASLREDQRVEAALFCLLVPFLCDAGGEMEETVRNVCINGLKLPVASCDCVRRMIDAYNTLCTQSFTTVELSASPLAPETLKKLFDALYLLNDGHVFPDALQVVLLACSLLEGSKAVAGGSDTPAQVARELAGLWKNVVDHPTLLSAFQLKLPINGKELQKTYGIEPKNIGATLLKMRLKLVLTPNLSSQDVAEWVRNGGPHA